MRQTALQMNKNKSAKAPVQIRGGITPRPCGMPPMTHAV